MQIQETMSKGLYSVTNLRHLTGNSPNLDLVNINAYIKFGEILSICSQDIERKQNLTSIKGHNSVKNIGDMHWTQCRFKKLGQRAIILLQI